MIVGIDITKYDVQISCLPLQDADAETISTQMGVEKYEIPLCLFKKADSPIWYYGDKAKQHMYSKEGMYVEDLWEGMLCGRELFLEDENYSYEQLMTFFMEKLMVLISQNGYTKKISALVFTTDAMTSDKIGYLRNVVKALPVSEEHVYYIDYKESFAAYATSQTKDLWNHDVFLFHYAGRKLKTFWLRVNQKSLPFQMRIGETDLGQQVYSKEELEASPSAGEEMDHHFDEMVEEIFARKIISSVYLIGDGFLPGWMKHSLRTLCRGRRVFQGNNLFTKGACYAGRWYLDLQKPAGEYQSRQMLACDVRIPVVNKDESTEYIYAAKKGQLWYRAGAYVQCVLELSDEDVDDENQNYQIEVELTGPLSTGGNYKRTEILELKDFPKRPKGASKVGIKVEFQNEHTGTIVAEDMGFGEFYAPSGLCWEKQFSLDGEPAVQKEGDGL